MCSILKPFHRLDLRVQKIRSLKCKNKSRLSYEGELDVKVWPFHLIFLSNSLCDASHSLKSSPPGRSVRNVRSGSGGTLVSSNGSCKYSFCSSPSLPEPSPLSPRRRVFLQMEERHRRLMYQKIVKRFYK